MNLCTPPHTRCYSLRSFTQIRTALAGGATLPHSLNLLGRISRVCGGLAVNADSIHFVHTPTEFYEWLQQRIRAARHRVVLSSLYLGDTPEGRTLVDCLRYTCSTHPDIKVTILLDYLRGTRGQRGLGPEGFQGSNSVKLLQPLIDRYGTELYLYHTPKLRGVLKRILPPRINEVIGVQHIKVYCCDDSLMLSGCSEDRYDP